MMAAAIESESRAEREERERAARASQAESDAATLLEHAAAERRAHGAALGWTEARTTRAIRLARLREPVSTVVQLVPPVPPGSPPPASALRTKADRALALLREMPIKRGPKCLVLVTDDHVIAVPSREFAEAFREEWALAYPDETIGPGTIARALESRRAERDLGVTDRVPQSSVRAVAGPDGGDDDERRTIVVSPDIEGNVDAVIPLLAEDGRTYQRAGELVHITIADDDADDERRARAPIASGSPTIRTTTIATLTERCSSSARWVRINAEGEARPVTPPSAVVAAVHARGQWRDVPPIVAVSETPILRPDWSVLQTPGYDRMTGYVYRPSAEFPPVLEMPTRGDACAALAELIDLFSDFPFVDDAARMVPISQLLTTQARAAIDGPVPAHGYDASVKGSGKTLAGTLPALIHTGRPPPLATFPNGRNGQEELEKMLGAYALAGVPLVFFDNVPIGVPFGGAPLEKCLTAADRVSLRRLGMSETPELPWRAVIVATGNNLEIADETKRRALVGRMVSDLERPEDRTGFRHPEIIKHVREHRPRLVVAGLTILRAFARFNGHDSDATTWGSFEAWSRLIPGAIRFAGGADVMSARVTLTSDADESTATLHTIVHGLPRLLDGSGATETGLSAGALLDALYPAPRVDEPPDGWESMRGALESACHSKPGTRPDTARLGTYFRGHRDRKIDGKALVVLGTSQRANRWGVK